MNNLTAPENLVALAHGIQLAVAPVFLLTAVGAMLGVLAGRLARIVDRARAIEARLELLQGDALSFAHDELDTLDARNDIVTMCMALATGCAVLIAFVVAEVFVGELARIDLSLLIAVTFVLGLALYIASLLWFLREVRIASQTVRVRRTRIPTKP